MKCLRWFIVGLVACANVGGSMISPTPCQALRAANYGYDWAALPYRNISLHDAASRSAYYQGLMGYTTMTRSRGTGVNIYEKLAGTDPNTYQVINVISHANPEHITARPHDLDGEMSCLYESSSSLGAHSHGIKDLVTGNYVYRTAVQRGRIQALTGNVPSVRWIMFQGCNTGGTYDGYSSNVTYHAYDEGVDTASGFYGSVYFGGSGSNSKTFQYNFAARYWKSLYEGKRNSAALDDGVAQVMTYHGWSGGYNAHRFYGVDGRLN